MITFLLVAFGDEGIGACSLVVALEIALLCSCLRPPKASIIGAISHFFDTITTAPSTPRGSASWTPRPMRPYRQT